MKHSWAVFLGFFGLVCVYVLQNQLFYNPFYTYQFNPLNPEAPEIDTVRFWFSKIFRFILNDGFALLVIWGLFGSKKYMRFAMYVFLFGFLILLPTYIILVTNFYIQTQAFQNHLHRLVLNPVLMMLLIPAFYYQKSLKK